MSPLSDDQMAALAAPVQSAPNRPLSDDEMMAMAQEPSFGQKVLGAVKKGAKALDSVTGAPTRAAIYAAQNGQNPIAAGWDQFANMDQDATTGADIAAKAGVSTQPQQGDYIFPGAGNVQNQGGAIPAQRIGMGIDMAANPLNLVGPGARLIGKAAEAVEPVAEAVALESKPNAAAISAAAQRLGFKPTPGMTSGSETVQGLESSLSQSPSIPGALVRRSMKPIQKGLQSAAEDVMSGAGGSAYGAGDSAQNGILSNVGEKISNIKMAYEPFNAELPKMVPNQTDMFKLADDVAKAGKGNLSLTSNMDKIGESVANKVMDSSSLADIEDIRKQVGNSLSQAYRNGDYNAVDALTKMKDRLSNFRDDQFVKLAQDAYPGAGGKNIGQQMVNEYKNAMQTHANLMSDLGDIKPIFGIKANNPRDFVEAFSEIPPEQLQKKLFNSGNYNAIQKVQQYFPEEFQTMKNMKLQEIRNQSLANPVDPANSPVDPSKLAMNISRLQRKSPEVARVLFGDKAQKVQDIQTVMASFPEKMGPSGTPQGEQFAHMADTIQQAADVARYGAYRAMGSPRVAGAVNAVAPTNQNLQRALNSLPQAAGPGASIMNRAVLPGAGMIPPAAGQPMQGPIPQQPNVSGQSQPMPTPARNPAGVPVQPAPIQQPQQQSAPQMPDKGPDKWAVDGLQNLKGHISNADRELLDEHREAMLIDPKMKQLLITASNYKPGSKPLNDIMKHLKKRLGDD